MWGVAVALWFGPPILEYLTLNTVTRSDAAVTTNGVLVGGLALVALFQRRGCAKCGSSELIPEDTPRAMQRKLELRELSLQLAAERLADAERQSASAS
jgi:hypothetical protein